MKLLKRILKWPGIVILVAVLGSGLYLFVAYWQSSNDCDRDTAVPAYPMKAIRKCEYGSLTLRTVEKPIPTDDQVLIKVRAASLNAADGHLLRGSFVMRPLTGMRKPKDSRFGIDCAGTVEAVGKNVTQFKPGDEVFGAANGAIAEYVCAPQNNLLPKPANLTFEQSAAVGDSAFTALAAVRDQGKVQPGHRVLINGASGGVGTFAVQIAKSLGAHVIAVCSERNVALVRSIGADEVIDYTKEDFTQTERRYDVILDLVGNRSISECRRALTPRGTYVLVGVKDMGRWFGLGRQFKALALSPFVRHRMRVFVVRHNREDLAVLKELAEAGRITPVIDRRYAFDDVAEAFRYQGEGHSRGKIVVTASKAPQGVRHPA